MTLWKSQGYGKIQQTGSRIKGRGCGNNASPCSTLDINSDAGAISYLLNTLKVNR
jgi:hypothetical protein